MSLVFSTWRPTPAFIVSRVLCSIEHPGNQLYRLPMKHFIATQHKGTAIYIFRMSIWKLIED